MKSASWVLCAAALSVATTLSTQDAVGQPAATTTTAKRSTDRRKFVVKSFPFMVTSFASACAYFLQLSR